MLRMALVGAGAMGSIMGRDHYPELRDVAELRVVVDRDPDRGRALADELGIAWFPSLEEAIAAGGLDAVDVRLPHSAHAPAALTALRAGLHVLIEKPVALSIADGVALRAARDAAGVTAAIAENYPHLPSTRAARSAIDADALGGLLAIRTTRAYTLDGVWARTAWRRDGGGDSGLLWDQGTHHTSLIRALGGEVRSVAAMAAERDGAETITLSLRLSSGVLAQSLYCWGVPRTRVETEAVVLGQRGRIEIGVDYDGDLGGAWIEDGDGRRLLADGDDYYASHRLVVRDFAEAVTTGRPPRVPLESGFEDVRVLLAARRSLAEGGRAVEIDDA